MLSRTDVALLYDGSFEGLLCCLDECMGNNEIPLDITNVEAVQGSLIPPKAIETDGVRADIFARILKKRAGQEAFEMVQRGFLTCAPHKEMVILAFVRLCFDRGPKAVDMLGDDRVARLSCAVRHLANETHLLLGFVRFAVHGQVLVATIDPKNFVLPLLAEHFADRYPEQGIIIFDNTHKQALVYRPYEWVIAPMERLDLPPVDTAESNVQRLWKGFYDAIAIEGRFNPKCRMGHMPKRYWHNMLEVENQAHLTLKQQESGQRAKVSIGGARVALP